MARYSLVVLNVSLNANQRVWVNTTSALSTTRWGPDQWPPTAPWCRVLSLSDSRGGVLTLTNPRRGQFFWKLPTGTLSASRQGRCSVYPDRQHVKCADAPSCWIADDDDDDDAGYKDNETLILSLSTQWGIITAPRSFKQHNLVNIRFIYMKISGTIAEWMLSLQMWK